MITLPFELYAHQKRLISNIKTAWNSGIHSVILSAPTGTGKSAIGYVVGAETGPTVISTFTKQLATQYSETFQDAVTLFGKANYYCELSDTSVDNAPCMMDREFICPIAHKCHYMVELERATRARVAIVPHSLLILHAIHGSRFFSSRRVFVVDEAHLFDDAARGAMTVQITKSELAKSSYKLARLGLPYSENTAPAWLAEAMMHDRQLRAKLSYIGRIMRTTTWTYELTGNVGTFYAVWPETALSNFLWPSAEHALLMSATIGDHKELAQLVGLNTKYAYMEMEHTIPEERRRVFYYPVQKVTGSGVSLTAAMVDTIRRVVAEMPGSGIIHTASYRLAKEVEDAIADLPVRIFVHDSSNRGEVIDLFIETSHEAKSVLISPSVAEGLDAKGDIARWQIIVKVPWPYLGDPVIKRRLDKRYGARGQAWYQAKTAWSIVQACGRATRSPNDWSVTVILDRSYSSLSSKNLPRWFKVKKVNSIDPVIEYAKQMEVQHG